MSKKLYPETDIQNIANAIRNLNGSSDTYTVSQMASAIALPENGYYLKESTEANPLSITDGEELNAQSCEVTFEPIQDLNGYDSPWIDSDVINKEPYLMRAVSGTATRIGNSLYDKLVGGTVAFNQLVQNGNFESTSGWNTNKISISANDNICTAEVTESSVAGTSMFRYVSSVWTESHKYLYFATVKQDESGEISLSTNGGSTFANETSRKTTTVGSWVNLFACFLAGTSTNRLFSISVGNTKSQGNKFYAQNCMMFDLTQMFGSTIADYIYSLEQATAGSGVAYFKSLFPKDYYDYNAGQLMSVKALSHKMVGFNQWDEEWELGGYKTSTGEKKQSTGQIRCKNLVPIIPSTTYYKKTPSPGIYWNLYYDRDRNYLGYSGSEYNAIFTTPNNAYYMAFTTEAGYGETYKNDICINLHWDGERDGEYEAYSEHIYPLDSDLELRGIPKLDANNNLYYDGDTYESDGTVTRKYGVVDLGSLDWQGYGSEGQFYANIPLKNSSNPNINIICEKYYCYGNGTYAGIFNSMPDKSCAGFYSTSSSNSWVYVKDTSYTDTTTFKSAMSGVYLVYELATPTTETADTFTNPQVCDEYGTEEYTDSRTVQIPVGHETYQANICEISGWSGLVLNQCGKNQFDKNSVTVSSITFENNDEHNTITRSGFFYHLPAGTYTLNCNSTTATNYIYANVLDSNGSFKGNVKLSSATETWIPKTVTLSNGDYLVIYKATSGQPFPSYDIMLQIELGTEATSYEPYQGKTYTATFPDTVYGGKLDFVSGKLFVDRIVETITSVEYYGLYGTDNAPLFYFDLQNAVKNYQNNTQPIENKLMSNEYSPISTETVADMKNSECRTQAANITYRIYFRDDRFTSKADINEWVVNNPIQITGKLATPQEITLTPEIIALLKGNNVLWTDGDNVKLKYFSKSLS